MEHFAKSELMKLEAAKLEWICLWAVCALVSLPGCGSNRDASQARSFTNRIVVETACGQCQFKMPGKGCDLAVRIEGQSFFVDGVNIDQLGDAHAADGFCNAVRQARVTGQIKDGRFAVATFELLPLKIP